MSRASRTARAALLQLLWQVPVYSVPFGIFFGTIFGAGLRDYLGAYLVALVFTGVIMLALWAVRSFVVPALERRSSAGRGPSSTRASYTWRRACWARSRPPSSWNDAHPGLPGRARRVAVFAMFSLLFAVLLTAVGLVVQYHKSSIEHARREKEMELARRIQHSFLPEPSRRRPASRCTPSTWPRAACRATSTTWCPRATRCCWPWPTSRARAWRLRCSRPCCRRPCARR